MNVDLLPQATAPFFDWLWRTSCQATVAILLVLVLQHLLRKVLSPAWRHMLWLLVLLRLLLPWSPESAFSLFNVFNPRLPSMASEVSNFVEAHQSLEIAQGATAPGATMEAGNGLEASKRLWWHWLPSIWVAGASSLAVYLIFANGRLGRRVRRERPVTDQGVLDILEDSKQEMGVRTPLTVVETPAVGSPSLLGFVRPRLLLPSGFARKFSRSELRYLFMHELAHVKRGDVPLNWLAIVPLILHWFNPLVWYALSRMRVDGELACDALALSHAKESENQFYGRTLIKIVESFSRPAVGPGMVGILENNNQMKERIRMIAQFKKTGRWPIASTIVIAGLALITFTDAQSQQRVAANANSAATDQGPPKIIATSPEVGATEVDPTVNEITVTFDRDMGGGMSWTGGGPEFPKAPDGKRAAWRDKRTCALPVKLEAGQYYRVGINSTSYQNFRSAAGAPAQPSAIYFTTKGASEALKRKASKPQIVGLIPKNGAQDVDPAITELRITFNVPMGGGFSWTGGGPNFPTIPEGKRPFWTEDKKTCVLPVTLQPGHEYRLGLNSPSHKNFQSAGGVPLDPIGYTFKTRQ